MTSNGTTAAPQFSLKACTVSRDIRVFGQLIDDMEGIMGEAWGDLPLDAALPFFQQSQAASLEFVAIALDRQDEAKLPEVANLIYTAKAQGVKVILVAHDVSPALLHQLLQCGASDFIPYPLPQNALSEAVTRLRQAAMPVPIAQTNQRMLANGGPRDGVLIPVQSMAGGAGGTTIAVNLAWELVNLETGDTPPRVLLIDMNLQFGAVSIYLDLPRREAVYELLSSIDLMDDDAFMQALQTYDEKLHVLTSPAELLPLDLIEGPDMDKLLEKACEHFDYVIVDMPSTIVGWTENVLNRCEYYFAPIDLGLRSAHNIQRLRSALRGEELPFEKLRFLLNRAPKAMDLGARSRIKRMAENLEIAIDVQLPDGGRAIQDAGDQGAPLAIEAPKNPLRKELNKLAASIHARHSAQATNAA